MPKLSVTIKINDVAGKSGNSGWKIKWLGHFIWEGSENMGCEPVWFV